MNKKKTMIKTSPNGNKKDNSSNRKPTKKVTQKKILKAARKVFAEHPYNAASIRMIGKKGRIDHPLINYYFPTKAELFEAVVEEICNEYYKANIKWLKGVEKMSPSRGLSVYIDRMIDYDLKHPEPLRIVALNIVQKDKKIIVPGYHLIQELFAKSARFFQETALLQVPPQELEMFTKSFNALIISYLGAGTFYAGVLGMNPGNTEYLSWVKETLIFIFLPQLKNMIFRDVDDDK